MTEKELLGLKQFLATFPDRVGAMLRNAPLDDEPVTAEDLRALAESEEWFRQNEGRAFLMTKLSENSASDDTGASLNVEWDRQDGLVSCVGSEAKPRANGGSIVSTPVIYRLRTACGV